MSVPSHDFKPVAEVHLELLRRWRNSPRIKTQVRDAQTITSEMQKDWFANMEKDATQQYFVVYQADNPIGVLAFTGINQQRCEWGCYIGEERVWPGSGLILAAAALDYAFGQLSIEQVEAEVFADNQGAHRLNTMFGFCVTGRKITDSGRELILYTQSRSEWITNRAKVLGLFPVNIQRAIAAVHFATD